MRKPPLYDGVLNHICDRAFFQALMMIHIANSSSAPEKGEPKVGGHASACGSSQHILAAIHLVLRNPEDYIASKPHVSPMDHALNFLLHNFRDKEGGLMEAPQRKIAMQHLRHYSRAGHPVFQSYHAESDPDSYRIFPSGSMGIPPVVALYTALAYQLAKDHKFELEEDPMFWCLMGDSEFREGSLAEAMPDAGDRQLKRVVWIVDYNRQNLDGTRISNEKALGGTDARRMCLIAKANGWDPVLLKHGTKRRELFATPGGAEFKRVLDDECTDFEFQALLEANRPDLTRKVLEKKSAKLRSWMKRLSDEQLHSAFTDLAGHDLQSLIEALKRARESEKPTFIVAYTVKGRGLRCQALSGNHSTLPEEDELRQIAKKIGASFDSPFEDFPEGSEEDTFLRARREWLLSGIKAVQKQAKSRLEDWRRRTSVDWPMDFGITALKFNPVAHTQWMWGQIAVKLDRLARGDRGKHPKTSNEIPGSIEQRWEKVAPLFLTMAPDVGTSTNTSPNMNGKLYGIIGQEDFEREYGAKDTKAPDVVPKLSERTGHLRFEIAEGNCMSAAGAFGKMGSFVGIPFFPAMTIYDFFIKRAHDQFYYNLYWKSQFATIGTPSGVTLAPEGAQHSWKSDFQIPHCVTWEPSFAKELEWILADTLRRHFTGDNQKRESVLIRCVTKGLVQKEFMDRIKRQVRFNSSAGPSKPLTPESEITIPSLSDEEILETIRKEALEGAYPLIYYRGYQDYCPGDNVVHIFSMGALSGEAIKASDQMLAKGIFANVFVVTSPDLCLGNFGFENNYRHLRENLGISGDLYAPNGVSLVRSKAAWIALPGNRIPIVSVHDGEPGLLDNIGSIVGVKQRALAVRHTSKSGNTADVYHFHGIDAEAIVEACERVLEETAEERFR